MNLTHLRTLKAVADHGSYTGAADALFLSQPSVFLQIRALERSTGKRLVERAGRGARLTSAGHLLLHYAERLLALANEAESALADHEGEEVTGRLTLAAGGTVSEHVVPFLFHLYQCHYPRVALRCVNVGPHTVDARILDHEFDIGIHPSHPTRAGVLGQRLFTSQMIAVAAPEHALAEREYIALAELVEHPFIVSLGLSQIGPTSYDWLTQRGIDVPVAMELPNEPAAANAAKCGAGVTIVPRMVVAQALDAGTLRQLRVDGLDMTRDYYLVWRRDEWQSRPVRLMIDLFRDGVAVAAAMRYAGIRPEDAGAEPTTSAPPGHTPAPPRTAKARS